MNSMLKTIRPVSVVFVIVLLLIQSVAASAEQQVTYYHYDALGSPIAASDEDGNLLWRQDYRPFGRVQNPPDTQTDNDINYAGHQRDDETDLIYMQARYYDPAIGRFYSNDLVGFTSSNLHSFNRYAYANNSPYKYVDPDGNAPILAPLAIFLAKEAGGEVFEQTTGLPAPTVKGLGKTAIKQLARKATKGGSVGAMRRLEFQASPKHGTSARNTAKGVASRSPTDGQHALDNSIQVKGTSPRRVGVDKANGEIVVFDRTSEGIFHGHVRSFKDLTSQQKNAIRNSGLVDKKGNF